MRINRILFMIVALTALPARAGLLLDRQPYPFGGPASDTSVIEFGIPEWQLAADDFRRASAASVGRIVWWGYYGSNFGQGAHPPSGDEIIRIRVHSARPGDNLPGDILYEETLTNPQKTATGRMIVGFPYPELRFQVDLATPLDIAPDTQYWLEVVQVGAPESFFVWENSVTPSTDGFAFYVYYEPDWRYTQASDIGLAFQLWDVPEPASLTMLGLGFFYLARRRKSGGRALS